MDRVSRDFGGGQLLNLLRDLSESLGLALPVHRPRPGGGVRQLALMACQVATTWRDPHRAYRCPVARTPQGSVMGIRRRLAVAFRWRLRSGIIETGLTVRVQLGVALADGVGALRVAREDLDASTLLVVLVLTD